MNRAGLFQAMEINNPRQKEPNVETLSTKAGFAGRGRSYNTGATIGYTGYKTAPKSFPQVADYSTRRGVQPCYTINRFVLRNPPQFDKTHGLVPIGGQSRTQRASMGNPRPLDLRIHQPRSNINGWMPSSIPLPGLARVR